MGDSHANLSTVGEHLQENRVQSEANTSHEHHSVWVTISLFKKDFQLNIRILFPGHPSMSLFQTVQIGLDNIRRNFRDNLPQNRHKTI